MYDEILTKFISFTFFITNYVLTINLKKWYTTMSEIHFRPDHPFSPKLTHTAQVEDSTESQTHFLFSTCHVSPFLLYYILDEFCYVFIFEME
jgi:hypothetical protein